MRAQARISDQVATTTAHLRTLAREIDVRLLDVGQLRLRGERSFKESECADFSRQSTNLHPLATRPGQKCGLDSPGSASA